MIAVGNLFQWVNANLMHDPKLWLRGLAASLERLLDIADAEVGKLFNFSHDCRLFNLRNPREREGVPQKPTLRELRTGKRDPKHQACVPRNVDNSRAMMKDLLNMEVDLLGCTGTGADLIINLLGQEGLARQRSSLLTRCLVIRKRRIQFS